MSIRVAIGIVILFYALVAFNGSRVVEPKQAEWITMPPAIWEEIARRWRVCPSVGCQASRTFVDGVEFDWL